MAEALVNLTSFKRHVTRQAETVGGPNRRSGNFTGRWLRLDKTKTLLSKRVESPLLYKLLSRLGEGKMMTKMPRRPSGRKRKQRRRVQDFNTVQDVTSYFFPRESVERTLMKRGGARGGEIADEIFIKVVESLRP